MVRQLNLCNIYLNVNEVSLGLVSWGLVLRLMFHVSTHMAFSVNDRKLAEKLDVMVKVCRYIKVFTFVLTFLPRLMIVSFVFQDGTELQSTYLLTKYHEKNAGIIFYFI